MVKPVKVKSNEPLNSAYVATDDCGIIVTAGLHHEVNINVVFKRLA